MKISLYTRQTALARTLVPSKLHRFHTKSENSFFKKFSLTLDLCVQVLSENYLGHSFKVQGVITELYYANHCSSNLFETLTNYLSVCCRELIHSRNHSWVFETLTLGIVIQYLYHSGATQHYLVGFIFILMVIPAGTVILRQSCCNIISKYWFYVASTSKITITVTFICIVAATLQKHCKNTIIVKKKHNCISLQLRCDLRRLISISTFFSLKMSKYISVYIDVLNITCGIFHPHLKRCSRNIPKNLSCKSLTFQQLWCFWFHERLLNEVI